MAGDSRTFRFSFDPVYRLLAAPFGVTPRNSWVRLDDEVLVARFGPWKLETPFDNIEGAEETGPFSLPKTAGPAHLSFADRGLTFATNGRLGACIRFREPVPGIAPSDAIKHPGLTVTVDDVPGFVRAVQAVSSP